MTLKELLECEFTINENGKMVAEVPIERINEIADILTNQKERIDKAIEYIKKYQETQAKYCYIDFDSEDIDNLLEILGDKENE